jgi:hypothetical protein
MRPNKALQLTPSRHASTFHDRSHVLRNAHSNHNPRSGQLSLALGHLMKDIASKITAAFITFEGYLYADQESAMCKLHEPFESLVQNRHNCLGCNFANSTGQIRDFFTREIHDPRSDVNDVMTDLIMKLYLLIERIYFIFDIIKLPDEYRFRHFQIFQDIHKWANFIKHPKAFLLVHHPQFFLVDSGDYDASKFEVSIDQPFVNKFYSGPDNNKSLFDRLKNKTKVAVLYPDPEVLIDDFCKAADKFIKLIQNNEVYVEILSSRTTYETYFTELDTNTP